MPQLIGDAFIVNDVISTVNEEDRKICAQYVCRGTFTQDGKYGDLFDLMRSVLGGGTLFVVLYDLRSKSENIDYLHS